MKLTSTILNVAKVLSIVAFASIPSLVAAQSNLSYENFDADEIAIISEDNQALHKTGNLIDRIGKKVNTVETQQDTISILEIYGKYVAVFKEVIRHLLETDDSEFKTTGGMDGFKLPPKSSYFYLFGFVIWFWIVCDKTPAMYNMIKNLLCRKNQIDPTDYIKHELDLTTKHVASAVIVLYIVTILLILYDLIFRLSYFHFFSPIFNTPWYESLIINEFVPRISYVSNLMDSIANSVLAFSERQNPKVIIYVFIIFFALLIFGAFVEENKETPLTDDQRSRFKSKRSLNKKSNKLGYKKIKQEKESHGDN